MSAAGRLRVGFCGLGRIFPLHLLGYEGDPRVELVAACDPDPAAREAAVALAPGLRLHADLDGLLGEALDLVEVLSPHPLHAEQTIRALEAGAHVSVQKPMALDDGEAAAMEAAALAAGRQLRVFESYLFLDPLVRAKALIEEGAVGRPLHLRLRTLAGNPAHAWKVPDGTWRWRAQLFEQRGLGRLTFDDGHHRLATALWLFGPVQDVAAMIDRTQSRTGPVDAPASIMWRHRDPPIHVIWDVIYAPEMAIRSNYYALDERFEITGERGIIKINRAAGRMLDEPIMTLYRDGKEEPITGLEEDWAKSFSACTRHFVDRILEGRQASLAARDARQVLGLSRAIAEAATSGRRQSLDNGRSG